jgi:hypothetical protein
MTNRNPQATPGQFVPVAGAAELELQMCEDVRWAMRDESVQQQYGGKLIVVHKNKSLPAVTTNCRSGS